MSDSVNHPAHYTNGPKCFCGRQIECIDVTERMSFSRGNAVKYLWRAGKKDDEIQDLRKAHWYVSREIKRLESMQRTSDRALVRKMTLLANEIASISVRDQFLQDQIDAMVDDLIDGLLTLQTMASADEYEQNENPGCQN